jgi:hypothetical protein
MALLVETTIREDFVACHAPWEILGGHSEKWLTCKPFLAVTMCK